jgi:hypothetical protein
MQTHCIQINKPDPIYLIISISLIIYAIFNKYLMAHTKGHIAVIKPVRHL